MIQIGQMNNLTILRETSVGLYLGDDDGEDVLLPNKYVPEQYAIEDDIDVFVYLDSGERKVATTLTPELMLHEFGLLEVVQVTSVGAFLDWGLEKHLLVPFSEQRMKMEKGRWYVIYLDLDLQTNRLFGTNKIDQCLQNVYLTVAEGDAVDLMVFRKTELGYPVIVNNKHEGLIYSSDVFQDIRVGDKLKGYVRKIREGNKLDIALQPAGYKQAIVEHTDLVEKTLAAHDGFIAITDKSSPEEIYDLLGISKKAFKKAIGALYKSRKITLEEDGIRLIVQS